MSSVLFSFDHFRTLTVDIREKELTDICFHRRVWEHHVEEGFSGGPAGVSCWLFLPWQPRPAGADSAVYQPAKLPVSISEREQPKQPGAGDLHRLGDSHNSANPAVGQSGSRVSKRFKLLR